jgi:hypothetical protein
LKEKKLKEYTLDKAMENDEYFTPLSDEEEYEQSSSEFVLNKTKKIISNEEELRRAKELDNIKNTYFNAKYNYEKGKIAEK